MKVILSGNFLDHRNVLQNLKCLLFSISIEPIKVRELFLSLFSRLFRVAMR